MRYIVFSLGLPLCLSFVPEKTLAAEFKSQSSSLQNLSPPIQSFDPTARRLVQEQINLIARIEQSSVELRKNPWLIM